MIVEHDDNLVPFHHITQWDRRFKADLERRHDNWVELAEHVPHGELKLERCPDTGAVLAFHHPPRGERRSVEVRRRLKQLPITVPDTLTVGAEAVFAGVPTGTTVAVNGTVLDTMDGSGTYEIVPVTAGRYTIRFELAGYRPLEVTLEATG